MSDTEERKQVIMEFLQRPLLSVYDYAVDEIVRLRAENTALTAAVERVRALHEPIARDILKCVECKDYAGHHVDHPCPTLRALEGTP